MVDDISPEDGAEYFRSVAARLKQIANDLQFEERRRSQLRALANGFDRHAERLERQASGPG